MKSNKGYFKPFNPQKYKGDPTNIVYRSSWELRVMSRFDTDPNILEWASEEFSVHYRSKSDGRVHRYFPDFRVKLKDKDGKVRTIIIEVKPLRQTLPPVKPKVKNPKSDKRFFTECLEYAKNQSKWEAAKIYCKERGFEWLVMTEVEIFGKKF